MAILVDLSGPPGTGLDLTAVWFNVAADMSDVRAFHKVGGPLSLNSRARAEVQQLANRRRLVREGDVTGAIDLADSLQVPLVHLNRDDAAWLRNRTGVLMCVRDHVGTKFFGTWLETPREVQSQFRDWINVSLSIDQVTHSEAV